MAQVEFYYTDTFNGNYVLKAIKKVGDNEESIEVSYQPLREDSQEFKADVSSAIGLFRERDLKITLQENERLERCLADLLMCLLYPHLKEGGTTILIKGPPLSKLIGRIGYRFPKPDLTIAFVTVDERFLRLPTVICPNRTDEWDGPFPELQEDSITRTFYHLREPQLRLDLFTQGLSRFPVSHYENNIPYGIGAKLEGADSAIKKFAESLRKRQEPLQQASKIRSEKKDTLLLFDNRHSEEYLDLAARRQTATPRTQSPDPLNPIEHNRISKGPGLSDEETFDAIFKNRNSQTGQKRFDELIKFFAENRLGTFIERIQFLRFITRTLEALPFAKSWVFSQNDLKRWYREFNAGQECGTRL